MILKLLIPILALLGILDAGYLTYEKLMGIIPPCSPAFDCETVLQSPWSSIGPIPVSVIGMLYYCVLLVIGSLLVLDVKAIPFRGRGVSLFQLLRLISTAGLLSSLGFVYLMAVVIQAWCPYCIVSAVISTVIFLLVQLTARFRRHSPTIQSEYPLNLAFFAFAYQVLLKPVLFRFNPEMIHHLFVRFGTLLGKTAVTRALTRWSFSYPNRSSQEFAGLQFPNRVGLSAGFDYDADLTQILPDIGFGFATLGTVTLHPYEGNTRPMLTRFPNSKALLVNKGFKSIGARAVIKKLEGKSFRIPIGISIGSTNTVFTSAAEQIADVVETFRLFEASSVAHAYYELNISCPNTKGGQPFTDAKRLDALLKALRVLKIKKPVFVKLPIDIADGMSRSSTQTQLLSLVERMSKESWIVGLISGNLTKDHENTAVVPADRAYWKEHKGGVSGKPTFERSNALISALRKRFGSRFLIIGTGGVFSGEDAATKLHAGADLVQLITGMIYQGPQVIGDINWVLSGKDSKKSNQKVFF